jgi:hypothetical protein
MSKPKLFECSFTFTQEGNCNGSTQDLEQLTINCESSLGIDEDEGEQYYFVLKTDTGWSVDSVDELKELLDRIEKSIKGGQDESQKKD